MIYRIIPGLVAALLAITAIMAVSILPLQPLVLACPFGWHWTKHASGRFQRFLFFGHHVSPVPSHKTAITCVAYPALLLLAAVFRTSAWAFYGAELATTFIVAELVMAGLLFFSASRIGHQANLE